MKKRITKTLDFIQSEAITDNKPKKRTLLQKASNICELC